MLITKYMGKETYGEFTIIYSIVILVATSTFAFIKQGMLRFYIHSDNIKKNKGIKLEFYNLVIAFYILAQVPLIAFTYFFKGLEFSLLSSLLLFFNINYMFAFTVYQLEKKSKKVFILEFLVYFSLLILLLVISFLMKNNQSTNIIYLLSIYAISFSTVYFINKDLLSYLYKCSYNLKSLIQSPLFKKISFYSFGMVSWISISYLLNIADRYIVSLFYSIEIVGEYTSIYDLIFKMVSFISIPVLYASHPYILQNWEKGKIKKSLELINGAIKLEIVIFTIFIFLLYFTNEYFFQFFLGLKPISFHLVFSIALGSFLWQISLLVHKVLELSKNIKFMVISLSIALITNIILNLLLVPSMGYSASIFITPFSILIYIVLVLYKSNKITVELNKEINE